MKGTPGRRNHLGKGTKAREKTAPLGLLAGLGARCHE